jgi:hypothetical protein
MTYLYQKIDFKAIFKWFYPCESQKAVKNNRKGSHLVFGKKGGYNIGNHEGRTPI